MLIKRNFKNKSLFYAYSHSKDLIEHCLNLEDFYSTLDRLALNKDTKLYKDIKTIREEAIYNDDHMYENFPNVEFINVDNSYNWDSKIIFQLITFKLKEDKLYKVNILKFHTGVDVRGGYTNDVIFASELDDPDEDLSILENYLYYDFLLKFEYGRFWWYQSLSQPSTTIDCAHSRNEDEYDELTDYIGMYYEEYPDYFVKAFEECNKF